MITLLPFERSDFPLFKSWIGSAEELLQFAGPYFSFPLSDQQLEQYIQDPKRRAFKITDTTTTETIGHCELNFERDIPRLCRILIAKSSERNKGYGKSTVNALLKLLFTEGNYDIADLNVYDWNYNAIRCYETVGFRINENIISTVTIGDETWKSLNKQINKSTWKANLAR
ncbi:GNAT family protein [Sphingobacterium multivorum]|uniref:GNAT family N-acetyltransferase n=1 Tax=Sphingobacterium multivorum TaxID=28454 RepID=UPI002FD89228